MPKTICEKFRIGNIGTPHFKESLKMLFTIIVPFHTWEKNQEVLANADSLLQYVQSADIAGYQWLQSTTKMNETKDVLRNSLVYYYFGSGA